MKYFYSSKYISSGTFFEYKILWPRCGGRSVRRRQPTLSDFSHVINSCFTREEKKTWKFTIRTWKYIKMLIFSLRTLKIVQNIPFRFLIGYIIFEKKIQRLLPLIVNLVMVKNRWTRARIEKIRLGNVTRFQTRCSR